MTSRIARLAAAVCLVSLGRAGVCVAQPTGAQQCEIDASRRRAAWAADTHSWFATAVELESRELQLDACRARASAGEAKVHNYENFGRVLFTGEGLHPVAGTIVPGNGLAAGLSFSHESATSSSPLLRFHTNAEARVSVNGSWKAGASIDVLGSEASASNSHFDGLLSVEHWHVKEISFFGIGPDSGTTDTPFGLDRTSARFTLSTPSTHGVDVFGQAEALHARPTAMADATTYAVLGAGFDWNFPEDPVSTGYSTSVSAVARRYQEVGGRPLSFSRSDITWINWFTPDTDVDLGTFWASARLVASATGGANTMPFYLQPTLGGSDIASEGGLRSYHDYRFRAPDLVAAQFEYTRAIWDPVGLLAFYDLGTVGDRLSALRLGDLRHSVGVGLTLRLGDLVFAEIYFAWGGTEGSRFNFSGNSNAVGNGPLRGVF